MYYIHTYIYIYVHIYMHTLLSPSSESHEQWHQQHDKEPNWIWANTCTPSVEVEISSLEVKICSTGRSCSCKCYQQPFYDGRDAKQYMLCCMCDRMQNISNGSFASKCSRPQKSMWLHGPSHHTKPAAQPVLSNRLHEYIWTGHNLSMFPIWIIA